MKIQWIQKFFVLSFLCLSTIHTLNGSAEELPDVDHSTDPIDGRTPPVNWAKIRVWNTNLPGRAGHVSLETDSSYISIWPDSSSPDARTIEVTTGFTPYVHAPALSIGSYAVDFRFEENTRPDSVYLIRLNSVKINEAWANILAVYAEVETEERPGVRKIEHATWLAPSGSLFPAPHEGYVHVNCASAVLLAMQIGGVDVEKIISNSQLMNELVQSSANLLADTSEVHESAQQLLGLVGMWGFYKSIIKPNDIGTFVQTLIRDRAKTELRKKVGAGQIVFAGDGVDHEDDKDDILWAIDQKFDKGEFKIELADEVTRGGRPIMDVYLSLSGALEEVGDLIRGKRLTLNHEVIDAIRERKGNRARITGTTFGGIIGAILGAAATDRDDRIAGAVVGGAGGAALGLLASEACVTQ